MRGCDGLEYGLSRWWGSLAYASSMLLVPWVGWDTIDRWIYMTNALLMVLLIGNARRSDKAMHIKLDEIDPREDHNALEACDEPEMRRDSTRR